MQLHAFKINHSGTACAAMVELADGTGDECGKPASDAVHDCMWLKEPHAWWCAVTATEPEQLCRQCAVVVAWIKAGADPDTAPSFLGGSHE